MCGSSGGNSKPKPEPKPPATDPNANYWDWWNSPQANQSNNGDHRLNRLAIGDRLKTSQGTSRLKNLEISPRDTTGISTLTNNRRD